MDKTQIKQLRQRLGISQEDFARRLGVTLSSVQRWEAGKGGPSKMAQRLLNALQEEVDAVHSQRIACANTAAGLSGTPPSSGVVAPGS